MSLMESIPMFDLEKPMVFPDTPRVRASDPVTSHEAADTNDVPRSHRFVLTALTWRGAQAQFEVEESLRNILSPSRVRSALSELEALGMVKRTDEFRLTPSGRRAQVWSVA